eukprot:s327_g27.t1
MGSLRSLTLQPRTRIRYDKAKKRFYDFLENNNLDLPKQRAALDSLVCDYLEELWATGEGRALASDTLAALQDASPKIKGCLQGSWRLLKTWNANEIPNRAPPLPERVLQSLVGYFWFHRSFAMGLSLLLGYYAVLRTGELLGVRNRDVTVDLKSFTAVISLGYTKGGKRTGAAESVTVSVKEVVRRLAHWKRATSSGSLLCPSPHVWRKQFASALSALSLDPWEFRPYSLRRGGATFWFGKHGSLDKILLQGRWMAARTARTYLNEGLAVEKFSDWKSVYSDKFGLAEALEVFGKELAPSQLKLVVMYAERQRSPQSNGSHLEDLRSTFERCEAEKLRGLPVEEVDSWRHALQIFYERQVAQRRTSEPEVQRSKEDRVAAELFKALNATPIREPPEKRARGMPRLPAPAAPHTRAACTAALRDALQAAGARWHGLRREELKVPGLVVDDDIPKGTVLLKIPRELHFSRPNCRETFPELYEACEALPSADREKREEAADALCLAHLLQAIGAEDRSSNAVGSTWNRMAEVLLAEDFRAHPYVAAWERRPLEIPCSAEPELIRAQADYVRTVYSCMRSTLGSKELPEDFDEGLFLQAWLCLLTRRFRGPEGSALVPGVDFLNHSWEPNASSDWDEESGAVIVTATRDLKQGDEVFISYGDFSNPLLFRTYGFTLPARCEPCRSCTFTEEELLATAPKEVAADLQALPNLHLNSMQVTDELAVLLQVWQGAGAALRQLCQKRLQQLAPIVLEMRWQAEPLEIEPETDELRIAFSEFSAGDRSRQQGSGGLEHLEGALHMAEMEGAPICKIGEEQEPWHLPRGLHRLAPLAAKHQKQLQKLRSRVEELLMKPTLELLDIPAEADSYEVAGSRRGFSDPSIEAARKVCERGLSVRMKERSVYMRLGPRNDQLDRDVAGHPASVLVTLRRDETLPEEQFTTDSNGCCFLPEGTEGIKVTLPNEPGLLPMNVSMCLLRRGWHREQLENDPQMLRALVLPGSGRCYLSLGGARSHFPSHGWQPAQLQLRLSSRLNVRCPYAGCTWTGHEGDLASHQLQCEEVRRIRRAVELRRNAARRDLWQLQVALSWCSEQSRSDLDMSIEHPCGKTVSYSRTQCLECGAELDIDSTGAAGELAIENITWPEAPPEGNYTVYVELFRGPKVSFHLLVQSNSGDSVRLFSHNSSFFDAGPRQVAATFQVTSQGIVFNPGACGLFRRAAYVSMLTRRLNSDVKAKASSASKAERWDMSTDSDGWCRIGRNQKSLWIAPPKALGFELCLPVEVLCQDMPSEVMFPQKGPSGRRNSRQW